MFDFDIISLLQNFIVLFTAITVHEFSHGFIAHKLGDPTAKMMGRLTLNPLAHLDPLGAIMMIFCRFGWAKPVPVNPYYFKDPKRDMVLVSVAGPLSNLILAFIVATICPFLGVDTIETYGGSIFYIVGEIPFVSELLITCLIININFAVFNLIPFPPLDGSKILFSLLPNHLYNKFLTYERYGTIILIGLSISGILGKVLGIVINPILSLYINWINFLGNMI
ncbi:MAG: site-2 protease family protein [Clostridia bacterium]|nr:site-2 protease family protein [Clostridia bacterium]